MDSAESKLNVHLILVVGVPIHKLIIRYIFMHTAIEFNMILTYQHQHDKGCPKFIVRNDFESPLPPDDELKACTNY